MYQNNGKQIDFILLKKIRNSCEDNDILERFVAPAMSCRKFLVETKKKPKSFLGQASAQTIHSHFVLAVIGDFWKLRRLSLSFS